MIQNRILRNDKISPLLVDYSKTIGNAVNEGTHRNKFKEFLKSFDHHDEFYTETNFKERRITWSYGINKWLGHPDPNTQDAPLDLILEYVHPFIADWYKYYLNAISLVFTQKETSYLKSRFVINFPILHSNGQYLLIRQMSMPFGKDENNKIVSFINSFTIFGKYRGEPLKLKIYEGNEKVEDDSFEKVSQLICPCIRLAEKNNLTKSFFSIIEIIRSLRSKGEEVSAANIVKHFKSVKSEKIEKASVNKNLQRLKERLKWLLSVDLYPFDDKVTFSKEYFPDHENVFHLIDFFEHSGILRQLQAFKRGNIKDRQ